MIEEEGEQACSGGKALPLDSVLTRSSIWIRKLKHFVGIVMKKHMLTGHFDVFQHILIGYRY